MCYKTQPTIPKHERRVLRQDLTPAGRRNLYSRDANDSAFTKAMNELYQTLSPHARRVLVINLHHALKAEE
jgi:hypothetical protein